MSNNRHRLFFNICVPILIHTKKIYFFRRWYLFLWTKISAWDTEMGRSIPAYKIVYYVYFMFGLPHRIRICTDSKPKSKKKKTKIQWKIQRKDPIVWMWLITFWLFFNFHIYTIDVRKRFNIDSEFIFVFDRNRNCEWYGVGLFAYVYYTTAFRRRMFVMQRSNAAGALTGQSNRMLCTYRTHFVSLMKIYCLNMFNGIEHVPNNLFRRIKMLWLTNISSNIILNFASFSGCRDVIILAYWLCLVSLDYLPLNRV